MKRSPRKPTARGRSQKTLGEIVNPKPAQVSEPEVINLCTSEPAEPDVNDGRRKRRRTSQTESVDVAAEHPVTPPRPGADSGGYSPQVIISASSPLPEASDCPADESFVPKTPPRKLLKLNANGKFSSPPSKTVKLQEDPDPEPDQPKKRTRQRKTAQPSSKGHLMVQISYGKDDASRTAFGARIDRILDGEERTAADAPKSTPKKRTPRKPKPKARHPFFTGKKDPPAPSKKESPRKASAVTPGKLRKQAYEDRLDLSKEAPMFDSALLKDRLMVKHPGAKDAPFPPRDWAHVRGPQDNSVQRPMAELSFDKSYRKRKRKQARLPFPVDESLLSSFTSELRPKGERQLRSDGFYEPSQDLAVPERLLISGEEIAEAVAMQLSVYPGISADDELSLTSSQQAVHPAIRALFDQIPKSMAAFDELRGESMSWAHKYAPANAAEVLQPTHEVSVLKAWLKSLAVQAVGGATAAVSKQPSSRPPEKPKKKRKKKPDDLDDFLVDSDEETNEMSEILDNDIISPSGSQRAVKSIVQVVHDSTKLNNAVLLSGPHGCGKSAAAYAVAKEMGYKVFEISSSERRSGRDVMEKVGDMTENHLVRHHGTESAEVSSSEEPNRIDEAFQKDLHSGRQGKMSAFFKPQTKPKSKPKEPKTVVKEKTLKVVQDALRKQPKDQQQSLILLEEVDVLFKDDKEFWTTVFKLITTSKRPFIMTCNDEDLVPLQVMSLHAILRFTQPATDLVADYMLLLAAAEGHLLQRNAVTTLYERHGHDLRASITALNFWCQMGVGDPREGLAWIYQRWPPGSDLDEQGRRLRVVSSGTYQEGMGVASKSAATTEEVLSQVWDEFGVEPLDALGWVPCPEETTSNVDVSLKQMSKFADALSAADSSCSIGLPASAPLDPAQPELPEKSRSNYIEGLQFLQTDEPVDYSGMSAELLVTMTLLANRALNVPGQHTPSTDQIIAKATHLKAHPRDDNLSRRAFACFDPVSAPAEVSLSYPGMLQSTFDGPLETIAVDLAPYVRSIVQHDQALEEQRDRLNLLTSDGRQAKRARTTRAARSALEGGQRATTRRERWFTRDLDFNAVLATAGKGWPRYSDPLESVDEQSRVSTDAAATSTAEEEEIKYE
ncbi:hypothetical protein M409DRAFT_61573 [Zasmidium cellare ATCC 36951]|uniref:AAA+ ATPase domain-containing protein n=1 Tax=Zasmidium cellare ATCC 36951 TaxID=1080233 RepID=A0A6A6BWW0_ZASCE|nr:uncharacterized protein M409DRAFT_61573 [Zasmidium cellare ATCC 36951]KAF2158528.1 hypothetical protein M409DRAFT_61573 [Zasmidium cellare ATCC 36951]